MDKDLSSPIPLLDFKLVLLALSKELLKINPIFNLLVISLIFEAII